MFESQERNVYKLPPTPIQLKTLMWELISELVASYGARFVPAFTKVESSGPSVVINLVSRTPGGKTGETYKPRLRAATVTADGEHVVEYYAQGVRCLYRIDVLSVHPEECDQLTDAIEEALRIVVPQLQQYGVDEFYLVDEQGTSLVERSGEQAYRNTIEYAAILERVFRVVKPAIRLVEIQASTGATLLKDVPIRRSSSGNVDPFQDTSGRRYDQVASVLYGADVPGIHDQVVLDRLDEVPVEYGVYVPGVDFVPALDAQGAPVLVWSENGRRPAPGAVYYLTFRVLSPLASTVLGSGSAPG